MLTRKEIRELQDEAMEAHAAFREVRKSLLENPDSEELRVEKDQKREQFLELEQKVEMAIAAQKKRRQRKLQAAVRKEEDEERAAGEEADADVAQEDDEYDAEEDFALDRTTAEVEKAGIKTEERPARQVSEPEPEDPPNVVSHALDEGEPIARVLALDDSANWVVPMDEPVDPAIFDVAERTYYEPVIVAPSGFFPELFANTLARFKRRPFFHIFGFAAIFFGTFWLLSYTVNFSYYRVESDAMKPTLETGDLLLVWGYEDLARGDVVVIDNPLQAEASLVRRIVAMGKDTVEIRRERLRIDDRPILETYLAEPIAYEFHPMTIGPNELFVLGDDRNRAKDGHTWGYGVPRAGVQAKAQFIVYPFSRWGRIESHRKTFAHVDFGRPLDRDPAPH